MDLYRISTAASSEKSLLKTLQSNAFYFHWIILPICNEITKGLGRKITQINVLPFLRLLDSPYTTDRNKALFVLFNSLDSHSKRIILQKGKVKLLALLRLKQPNNHRISYLLLKKISGKDFGENNSKAWEKWFSAAQSQRA